MECLNFDYATVLVPARKRQNITKIFNQKLSKKHGFVKKIVQYRSVSNLQTTLQPLISISSNTHILT